MSIAASSVECDDLRLSYSSVMSQIENVPDGSMTLNSSQDRGPIPTDQAKSSSSTAGMADLQGLCVICTHLWQPGTCMGLQRP